MPRSLCFLISSILLLAALTAQAQTALTLTADQLQNGQAVELDKLPWKYAPDNDPRFADPQFDDRAWATLTDSPKPQDCPSGWRGIGWFRLHLRVTPELANVALNLEMAHLGASEVYVNPQDEMFDYAATKRALAEAGGQSPQQLIEHLVKAGEAWAQGRAQDDDVTFVVLKVKELQSNSQG